jgi:hypothetical protein
MHDRMQPAAAVWQLRLLKPKGGDLFRRIGDVGTP